MMRSHSAAACSALAAASSLAPGQCPPNWLQLSPATSPTAHSVFGMTYDAARGRTVLFGGTATITSGLLAETWTWDGSAWLQLPTAHAPTARSSLAIAYDPSRGRIVLFGGLSSAGSQADTWEFDGADWSQVSSTGPPARFGHALAYHAGIQRIVLFGGKVNSNGPLLGDTWAWNGSAWMPANAVGPSARAFMGLTTFGSSVLLVGGQTSGAIMSDNWLFDGAAWSQVPTPLPTFMQPCVAYDSLRGRALAVFAADAIVALPNAWEYDGAAWSHVSNAGPYGSVSSGLAYDSARDRIVCYGGTFGNRQTWEWHGPAAPFAPRVIQQPYPLAVDPGQPAHFNVSASGSPTIAYRWRRNATDLFDGPSIGGGTISGAATTSFTIDHVFSPDSGQYDVVVSNQCGQVASTAVALQCPIPCRCYANCDGSVVAPCLNVNDFGCFLGMFATGTTQANCDGSTTPPVLNILDFTCFLNAFASGCT